MDDQLVRDGGGGEMWIASSRNNETNHNQDMDQTREDEGRPGGQEWGAKWAVKGAYPAMAVFSYN